MAFTVYQHELPYFIQDLCIYEKSEHLRSTFDKMRQSINQILALCVVDTNRLVTRNRTLTHDDFTPSLHQRKVIDTLFKRIQARENRLLWSRNIVTSHFDCVLALTSTLLIRSDSFSFVHVARHYSSRHKKSRNDPMKKSVMRTSVISALLYCMQTVASEEILTNTLTASSFLLRCFSFGF